MYVPLITDIYKTIYFFRYLMGAGDSGWRLWVSSTLGFFLGLVLAPIKGIFDLISLLYQDMLVAKLTEFGIWLTKESGSFLTDKFGKVNSTIDLRKNNFISLWFMALGAPAKILGIFLMLGLFPIAGLYFYFGVRMIHIWELATKIVKGLLAFAVSLVFYVPHKLLDELCTSWKCFSNAFNQRVAYSCVANFSGYLDLFDENMILIILNNKKKIETFFPVIVHKWEQKLDDAGKNCPMAMNIENSDTESNLSAIKITDKNNALSLNKKEDGHTETVPKSELSTLTETSSNTSHSSNREMDNEINEILTLETYHEEILSYAILYMHRGLGIYISSIDNNSFNIVLSYLMPKTSEIFRQIFPRGLSTSTFPLNINKGMHCMLAIKLHAALKRLTGALVYGPDTYTLLMLLKKTLQYEETYDNNDKAKRVSLVGEIEYLYENLPNDFKATFARPSLDKPLLVNKNFFDTSSSLLTAHNFFKKSENNNFPKKPKNNTFFIERASLGWRSEKKNMEMSVLNMLVVFKIKKYDEKYEIPKSKDLDEKLKALNQDVNKVIAQFK